MTDYEKQAEDFLKKSNTKLNITFKEYGKYFNDDKQARNIYFFTITRNGKKYKSTFGDSINNTQNNEKPTAYDILSCVEKYEVDTFDNFCNEYGYFPINSQKEYLNTQKIYNACKKQSEKIIDLFLDCIDELREIQ